MYAPCDEYASTMPFTLVPIGWCSTNSRNGINSLTTSPARGADAGATFGFGAAPSAATDDSSTSLPALRGGGDLGTGIGSLASGLPLPAGTLRAPRLVPPRNLAPWMALRLTGPRTGERFTKTQ